MQATSPEVEKSSWLPWIPLLVAGVASYGPVGWNYGFALYFLNYRHGFVKRGLVGELFSRFAFLSRSELLTIEYLFLAAAFALCYVVFPPRPLSRQSTHAARSAVAQRTRRTAAHRLSLRATDVAMFLLMLLCVWALLQLRPLTAAIVTLPLCCLGLMAHEAFSLMFYP